jgi:hypothetical protein
MNTYPEQSYRRRRGQILPAAVFTLGVALMPYLSLGAAPTQSEFIEQHCASCHNDVEAERDLDLTSLPLNPGDPKNADRWTKVHDRILAGEMPPSRKPRPPAAEIEAFTRTIESSLTAADRERQAREGRATQRRLNRSEFENALRDLLHAPWLQIKGQLPEDGEAHRFNKIGDALDVSHVQMARFMSAANYALREVVETHLNRPPVQKARFHARDERSLVRFMNRRHGLDHISFPDRQTFPALDGKAQPDVRHHRVPLTVGASDPDTRNREAVGWISSNYVTGFTSAWKNYRAPVAGRYRVRFSGYTAWAAPNGYQHRFSNPGDTVGEPGPRLWYLPNFDDISRGRRDEPITIYSQGPTMNRRIGAFDLTPEPTVHELGAVWLHAGESLVTDASRFYRSRPIQPNPVNPLAEKDGVPAVAFQWMEIEGPLRDEKSDAGHRLLFADLPSKKLPGAPSRFDVRTAAPKQDAERLLRRFIDRAYRRPVREPEVQGFLALIEERLAAGLSFAEAMLAGYTAVLCSPGFLFLEEQPGTLDAHALAARLAFFLWNSEPDEILRARAARGELGRPEVLQAETNRLLDDPKSQRFVEAFLDYWIDLRKIEDSTPSNTLYNDYYLDDLLTEAAVAESHLFLAELLRHDLPARNLVDSDFTFLNERLALHYGIPDVSGVAMRRVALPPGSPRGGFMTHASVLKVTANGTTTSPVLRGNWINERLLGYETPPPPPVAAVEPDIRGAVTIREQLAKHRADPSCASCHTRMDPPGFALENFDVMGGWRERYRGVSETAKPESGFGKNGHPIAFHYALPVDATGELPDGRAFRDVRELKKHLLSDEPAIARNLARQLVIYATGAPVRFADRAPIDTIVRNTQDSGFGVRSLVHAIVQSELFRHK